MTPLFWNSASIQTLKELFLRTHQLKQSTTELARITHWAGHLSALGLPTDSRLSLNGLPTHIFGGYFYNFSTEVPQASAIDLALKEGKAEGAAQWLVPTIRSGQGGEALRERGFVPVPCFVESALQLKGSVEETLREAISSKRVRELNRMGRKVANRFTMSFYRGDELKSKPEIVTTAAALHALNTEKYTSATNFYPREALQFLVDSPLGPELVIGIRTDRENGQAVQVVLCFQRGEELYYLAQGIDHERVLKEFDLYTASYLDLYAFAEQCNVTKIFFGRGKHPQKARLGANRFFLLEHWVKPADSRGHEELDRIKVLTLAQLGPELPEFLSH